VSAGLSQLLVRAERSLAEAEADLDRALAAAERTHTPHDERHAAAMLDRVACRRAQCEAIRVWWTTTIAAAYALKLHRRLAR
jgi:hypothetical protein